MGYRDPKAEGPAAHAVSALCTLLARKLGANDVQLNSILAELVKDAPADLDAPTKTTWTRWLNTVRTQVKRAKFSPARTASLNERLDRAEAGLPSARLWFALTHFEGETTVRLAALDAYLAQIAHLAGRPVDEVRAEFTARMETIGTARSNGDGRSTRKAFRGHIPSDFATVTVLADMRREAAETVGATRPTLTALPAGPVTGYGYDAATGRFEVEMAGAVYAYRVPAQVVENLASMDHSDDTVSTFLVRTVVSNPAFAWLPGQQAVRVCPACQEPVAQVHSCTGPVDAPYLAPVLVDLDPGAERIADDGTVVVVLDTLTARRMLASQPHVDVHATVILVDTTTGAALGSRHVVTGTAKVAIDDAGTEDLTCSCPAARCAHLTRAADLVRQLVVFGTLSSED